MTDVRTTEEAMTEIEAGVRAEWVTPQAVKLDLETAQLTG